MWLAYLGSALIIVSLTYIAIYIDDRLSKIEKKLEEKDDK